MVIEGPKECHSPAHKRTAIHPAQYQFIGGSGGGDQIDPFLNFDNEERQARTDEGEPMIPEESFPIEEEDSEIGHGVDEESKGQEDERGPGLRVGEQDDEEQEREGAYVYAVENGDTQQESDGCEHTELEQGQTSEPEFTQALEIESSDENFDGLGAQTDVEESPLPILRNRQQMGGRRALRLPTATQKATIQSQEPSPMEINKASQKSKSQILYLQCETYRMMGMR